MANPNAIRVNGSVSNVISNGMYQVTLDDGANIHARISSHLTRSFVRIMVGDRVVVEMSPLDLTKGLIVNRLK